MIDRSIFKSAGEELPFDGEIVHESLRGADRECVSGDNVREDRGLTDLVGIGAWAVPINILYHLVSAACAVLL